ncbi:MAG: HEAT repeat domain-containing protein [Bryobacteraceae bacterium]
MLRIWLLLFLCLTPVMAVKLDDVWKVLTDGAAETNANKRKLALSSLAIAGPNPRAVTLVASLLKDKEVDVRETAAAVLGEMNSRAAIPMLLDALDDEAPEVNFAAARSLWNLGDRRGKDVLLAVLAGERGVSAGIVKGTMRDARKRLRDPAGLAMLGAKEGAGMFLGPAAMGFVVFEELRKDGSAWARILAVETVTKGANPAANKVLEEALEDKSWLVRVAVLKALAFRGSRASIPKIEALLDDKHDGARYSAAAALVRIEAAAPRRAVKPVGK